MNEESKNKRHKIASTSNEEGAFERLVKWMKARDSEVFDSICFNQKTRELYVNSHIKEGTILMNLSNHVIISRQRLVPTLFLEIARRAFGERDTSLQRVEHDEDIALALYLASEVEEIKPYLDILPTSLDQNLPITWTQEERVLRLRGSPVLKKIEDDERQFSRDYSYVSTFLASNEQLLTCPNKEAFDRALVWVRSRAFGMDGSIRTDSGDSVPAMMPLLDLCNHARGKTVSKNLSYCFQDGCVVAKAAKDIHPGDVLRITYGALPNSHLLTNYGFCLDENIEPDGSSNDILDFQPVDGDPLIIPLRTGPKSYTYGKLVQAVECFIPEDKNDFEASVSEDEEESNPDSFLDGCDEPNEVSMLYSSSVADDGCSFEDGHDYLSREKEALRKLETRLLDLLQAYAHVEMTDDSMSTSVQEQVTGCSQDAFASILIRSEVRTLHFFLHAVRFILSKLGSEPKDLLQNPFEKFCSSPHFRRLFEQIEEMTDVYLRIRHPNFSTLRC